MQGKPHKFLKKPKIFLRRPEFSFYLKKIEYANEERYGVCVYLRKFGDVPQRDTLRAIFDDAEAGAFSDGYVRGVIGPIITIFYYKIGP